VPPAGLLRLFLHNQCPPLPRSPFLQRFLQRQTPFHNFAYLTRLWRHNIVKATSPSISHNTNDHADTTPHSPASQLHMQHLLKIRSPQPSRSGHIRKPGHILNDHSCPLNPAVTDGFSLRELYREASAPGFATSNEGRLMLLNLERAGCALDPPAAAGLLETLIGLAGGLGPGAADLLQDSQVAFSHSPLRAAVI